MKQMWGYMGSFVDKWITDKIVDCRVDRIHFFKLSQLNTYLLSRLTIS